MQTLNSPIKAKIKKKRQHSLEDHNKIYSFVSFTMSWIHPKLLSGEKQQTMTYIQKEKQSRDVHLEIQLLELVDNNFKVPIVTLRKDIRKICS